MQELISDYSAGFGVALTLAALAVLVTREALRIRTGAAGGRDLAAAATVLAAAFVLVVVARFLVLA
jgi:hypothetical protein